MNMALEIDRLAKSYHRRGAHLTVLRDVSCRIEPGRFVVIHGPSGSGKSTLLLAAGGLLQPDTGAVAVAGHDLYTMSPEQRCRFRGRHVGFVFQRFHLIPYLSVLENVLTPTLAIPAPAARARAERLIEKVGLAPRIEHRPAELSAGECQRVALCRAMLHDPPLVLADEPTGNLDEHHAAVIIDHLREHARGGAAVVLATHDSRITGDASLRLHDGRLEPTPAAMIGTAI